MRPLPLLVTTLQAATQPRAAPAYLLLSPRLALARLWLEHHAE
jgi:hypothetical protein